jgi:hypothetical protein
MFASLMSICNLAGLVSHESGALITHWFGITDQDFQHLWQLIVLTNLATLAPLPLLHWVPETTAQNEDGSGTYPTPESLLPASVPEFVATTADPAPDVYKQFDHI